MRHFSKRPTPESADRYKCVADDDLYRGNGVFWKEIPCFWGTEGGRLLYLMNIYGMDLRNVVRKSLDLNALPCSVIRNGVLKNGRSKAVDTDQLLNN